MEPIPQLNPDQKLVSRKPKRGYETALDMVRSMGLVLLGVLLVVLVTWRPAPDQPFQPVEPVQVAAGFADSAGFELLVPTLGSEWSANSAWLEPVTNDVTKYHWHIGWVNDAGEYLAIEQSNSQLPAWENSIIQIAESATEKGIKWDVWLYGGLNWEIFQSGPGDVFAYKTQLGDSLLVVLGNSGPRTADFVKSITQELSN